MAFYDDPNVFYDTDVFYDAPEVPQPKTKMARILRNWSRLNRAARLTAANLIKTKLTGNADVPTPNPSLAVLGAAIEAAEALVVLIGTKEQELDTLRTQRDTAIDAVVTLLGQEASTVEGATAGDEAKIKGAGFAVVSQGAVPVGDLPAPQDMRAAAGDNDGELDVVCDAVVGASTYEWQTSPNPADTTAWVTRGTTTKSSNTITGLASGIRTWTRCRAHGAAGPGAWSDSAGKMVP